MARIAIDENGKQWDVIEYIPSAGVLVINQYGEKIVVDIANYAVETTGTTGKPTQTWARPKTVMETYNTTGADSQKENNSMLKEIFGNIEIGEVKDAKITFTGAVAINAGNGRYKVYDAAKKTVVDTTELSMDGKGLIMKLPVQAVVEGDVTVRNGRYYFVKGTNEDGEIKVVSLDDSKIETFAPETNVYGVNFYTKVVSVLNMAGNAGTTTNPMQMIMMTKLLGNKTALTGNDDMLTMLALTSLNGNGAGFEGLFANPLMMMMLMGDKGGTSGLSGMLPLMMMGGISGGANPFASFGAPTAPVVKTTAADPKDALIAQLQKTVKELSKPAKTKIAKTEPVVTTVE